MPSDTDDKQNSTGYTVNSTLSLILVLLIFGFIGFVAVWSMKMKYDLVKSGNYTGFGMLEGAEIATSLASGNYR